jgi:phosphate-selective porin OprO/OprP
MRKTSRWGEHSVHFRGAHTVVTCCILFFTATPLLAADDTSLGELLVEKGLITQEELEEAREATAEPEAEEPVADSEEKEEEPKIDVSVGPRGLIVTSPDGNFVMGVGGRLQVDAGGFSGGITPLGDGIELRRGRFKLFGSVYENWDYKFEVNFNSSGSVSPTDAWIRYSRFKPFTVVVGHQKVPFSQQSMTSSNWQVFQERALLDAFIDSPEEGRRRLGGVIGAYGDHWNAYAGVFGEGLSDAGTSNEDWGTAGRAVIAPFAEERRVLAFGGAVYYRGFRSEPNLQYESKPESHLASVQLVDTGVLSTATDTISYNAEVSGVFGPLHAQGEYTRSVVGRGSAPTLTFDGWYVQGGVFVTGESRNYDIKSGKYGRIKPKRWFGAWEIALRYSSIDLWSQEITGGRESDVTVGLNWWVNQSVMFRFNYVHARLDPTSTQVTPGGGLDQNVNAFMGRAQLVF